MDFTPYIENHRTGKEYGTGNNKLGIEIDGIQYMLKIPTKIKNDKNNIEFTNSCISEHLGCSIFHLLGFETQETLLGTIHLYNKQLTCVACRDFEVNGWNFIPFNDIMIEEISHWDSLDDFKAILKTLNNQKYMLDYKDTFWKMFVVDILIGNIDRNSNNFGLLVNTASHRTKYAPIFDCDYSLKRKITTDMMKNYLNNTELFIKDIQINNSCFRTVNGRWLNYIKFIKNTMIKECLQAIVSICSKIDESTLEKIYNLIDNEIHINSIQKEFYKQLIKHRYELILKPAYIRAKKVLQTQ